MRITVETTKVARRFVYGGLFNILVASIFAIPLAIANDASVIEPLDQTIMYVLQTLPVMPFPVAAADFPGTWLFLSYMLFLIVGCFGFFGWAAVYYMQSALLGKTHTSRVLAALHFIFGIVGIYVTVIFFFTAGFFGGAARLSGIQGAAIINSLISWTVIPTALGMVVGILGNLLGVINNIMTFFGKQTSI
ncbi:MAG: hypothetical protein FJ358_02805 [Thaumarchaeota archaeon]|nr:hypothetical protein [Nitrososphaerota archaeon]